MSTIYKTRAILQQKIKAANASPRVKSSPAKMSSTLCNGCTEEDYSLHLCEHIYCFSSFCTSAQWRDESLTEHSPVYPCV